MAAKRSRVPATTRPVKGDSKPVPHATVGVQDRSSAATGTSLFQKADAGNRKLGQRDRTSG